MTITFLSNLTPGAPVFNGAAGSLIGLLDFCLVTNLGWSKVFSGVNTAAYRPASGNRLFLGVDDTATLNARIRGFEAMTAAGVAVASGTGPFPNDTQQAGGYYAYKSNDTTTARGWNFASDGTFFYLRLMSTGVSSGTLCTFGDLVSYATADAYATTIGGESSASSLTAGHTSVACPASVTAYGYQYTARQFTQSGSSVKSAKLATVLPAVAAASALGSMNTGVAYPSAIDGALYAGRVYSAELIGIRGHFPGLWTHGHNMVFNDGDVFTGSGDLAGRSFVVWSVINTSWQIMLETTDTWRT